MSAVMKPEREEVITRAQWDNRREAIQRMGCIACRLGAVDIVLGHPTETGGVLARTAVLFKPTGLAIEVHHLNEGGKAGQKRRGHRYTIGLCIWHHQGMGARGGVGYYARIHGPSYKLQSKAFRGRYGQDDDLLYLTDRLIHWPTFESGTR